MKWVSMDDLRDVLISILAPVFPAIVAAVLAILFPSLNGDIRAIVASVSVSLLIVIVMVYRRRTRQRKTLSVIVFSLTLSSFVIAILVITTVLKERPTVYFIVDASRNMQGIFEEVRPRVDLAMAEVPENHDIGLLVFGGAGLNSANTCDDVRPFIAPTPKSRSRDEVDKVMTTLSQTRPQGPGGLQNALLEAINQLANRKGLQKIVVITARPDTTCPDLDRSILKLVADQKQVQFQLTIIAIGTHPGQDLFENLADQGHFHRIESAAEIPGIVENTIVFPDAPYSGPYGAP